MAWLVAAYSLACLPLAFWWCCCRAAACSLPCCRSGTAPASSSTSGVPGFEFIFTSITDSPYGGAFCGHPGSCAAFYNGVSIILDYYGHPGAGNRHCEWRGFGAALYSAYPPCTELPDIRVTFISCSADRKTLTFVVSAGTYPGIHVVSAVVTITSTTAGDVICNTLKSGTFGTMFYDDGACEYSGATFTIQAIPT